jgi:tRNA dimethylallyltransferase
MKLPIPDQVPFPVLLCYIPPMSKPKVILIVGPTASGKTALSIELAKLIDGEVISADSRQVYRGLDIGSGKVTKAEMEGIPHHLIDIADPKERYSGADFVRDASAAIKDISARGKVSIIAGGTFFYTDLLRGKLQTASVSPNLALQAELEKLSTEELITKLSSADPVRAANIEKSNRRRLIRALEIVDTLGHVPLPDTAESEFDFLVFGIKINRETLYTRIETRLHDRLQNGMQAEVASLMTGGLEPQRLIDFGLEYRYLTQRQNEEITYEEMVPQLLAKLRQFAKRQLTWLKRDDEIIWKDFPVKGVDLMPEVTTFLNK